MKTTNSSFAWPTIPRLVFSLTLFALSQSLFAQDQNLDAPTIRAGEPLAPPATQAAANPARSASQQDPRVFAEYLNYLNPTILQYSNIETTWMVQNKNESDEKTLFRVEAQLWRQLQIEMNSSILPASVLSQSINFYRQVQCDKFRTEASGTSRTSIRNESKTHDGSVTQVQPFRGTSNQPSSQSAQWGSEANAISGTNSYTPPTGELISLSGRSVINIEERTYRTDCIQKRYEFRGVLNVEHFIRYSQVLEDFKLVMVRSGIVKIHANFVSRVQRFNQILNAVTSRPFVTDAEVKLMGFQSAENLVSALQNEISSLVSICTFLGDVEGLFKDYGYVRLARNIEGLKTDARLKFSSIKAALEVYKPPALKVIFELESQKNVYTLFTENFLQATFREYYGKDSPESFSFRSETEDPAQKYKLELQSAENSRREATNLAAQACIAEVRRMVQITKGADKFSIFSGSELSAVANCTSEVTIGSISANLGLSEIQSRGCILKSARRTHSYSYSFLFGDRYSYYYEPLVMLCPK